MLKYIEIIKGIRQSKGDEAWKFYDDQFRRLRKSHMSPWEKPIDELYNITMNKKYFTQPKSSNFNVTRNNTTPGQANLFRGPKLCFAFNGNVQTTPASINACKFCKGPHPQLLCNKTSHFQVQTQPKMPTPLKPHVLEYELAGYDTNGTNY